VSKLAIDIDAEPPSRAPWSIARAMQRSGRFYVRWRPLTRTAILELHRCEFQLLTPSKLVAYIFATFDISPQDENTELRVTEIATWIFRLADDGRLPVPKLKNGVESLL
jgi:hypothetical protein